MFRFGTQSRNRHSGRAEKRQDWYNIVVEKVIKQNTNEVGGFDRDILEWNIPDDGMFCMSF